MTIKLFIQKHINNSSSCYRYWFQNYHVLKLKCLVTLSVFVIGILILLVPTTRNTIITLNNDSSTAASSVLYKPKSSTKTNFVIDDDDRKSDRTILTFHIAFTVTKFTKLNLRCIESIFYFHPKAQLKIYSNAQYGIHTILLNKNKNTTESLSLVPIQKLIQLGYSIEFIPYTAANILQQAMDISNSIVNTTLAQRWMSKITEQYSKEIYWYSNESNLLRLCILYTQGGIYLDTDVILVRPLIPIRNNENVQQKQLQLLHTSNSKTIEKDDNYGLYVDNVMARDGKSLECAVMKFLQPKNIFLGHAINNFLYNYNGTDWGNNGPRVFRRTSIEYNHLLCPEPYNYTISTMTETRNTDKSNEKKNNSLQCWMQPLPSKSFQPISWRKWGKYCYDIATAPIHDDAYAILRQTNVYAVHMNNHVTGRAIEHNAYIQYSVCDILLSKFCILC
jgi:hypothetical protein